MTKAVEKAFEYEDDEEGAAKAAARLGPDGGPAAAPAEGEDALDELEDFESEDAWLDEELSDEELAALGEEDFEDEAIFEDEEVFEEDLSIAEDEALSDPEAFEAESLDAGAEEGLSAAAAPGARASMLTATALAGTDAPAPAAETGAGLAEEEDDLETRPVPRISIHAFCETPQTTALLERAAIDRRLSKAHLTMHMGGVAKAVDHFQSTPTPNLIIVETLEGGPALFAQLGELAQVCDPSTKVVIIGRVNDIGLYRELIRQGVSDYLVQPRSPLQIIRSIASLYVDPSAPPIGRTIAFVGARGGVGSSTLAHNVAWCAAEEHESDTVILDLDLPFGTASLDFEQDPTSGLIEALTSPERLDDVLLDRLLQKHTERLSLFTAPNLLDRDYDLDDQAFETVIDVVRGAAPTIVIDVPHMWTSWSKRVLQTADEIVITAAPDLASFRNTKNLVDVISASRPNDAPPTLVLNQFDPKVSSVQPEQYAEHVGLKPALVIGWEPQLFHTAATNAAPIFEVGAKTKTAQGLRDLTTRLLGRAEPPGAHRKFSLVGLFRKR